MTKKEALEEFKSVYKAEIFIGLNGTIDKHMRIQEWNNYTDMLCKEKRITIKQYESWSNPF